MNRRWACLFSIVLLFAATAGHAQLAVYGKLDATHVKDNVNNTSTWFYGPGFGVYDNFLHFGPVALGADVRANFLTGSDYNFRSVLGGVRLTAKPPLLPIRPYVEGLVGEAGTKFKSTSTTLLPSHYSNKLAYQVVGGLDWTLLPHLDFRVVELGYGRVSPVSSTTNSPSSSITSLSSGIVIRLF
jgi:hypothetical protein